MIVRAAADGVRRNNDGKVVTIYYYTSAAHPEQHIAATIWDPNAF